MTQDLHPGELTIQEPPAQMEFRLEGKQVGLLKINRESGKMEFEGDVEKSAAMFLDYICAVFNEDPPK